jgi:Flp pilus assembly protein TadG
MYKGKNEDGYTLLIITGVLVVFLGFTALSVDVGVLSSARASAQRAADAAALAGAFVFITRSDLTESTTPRQSDVIKENAIKTAANNKMLGAPVTIATTDVIVDTANRRVTVNVNQNQPTLFARILGENSANIHATAIAEAASSGTGDRCPKPWFIPNTVLSPRNGNNALCDACSASPQETIIDMNPSSVDYRKPSQYYRNWVAANASRQFTIKPQNPQGAIAPGQFFAIRLGDSSGGSDYETNIATCPAVPIYCASSYPSEPGNMVGPTHQGTCRLICYNPADNGNPCNQCVSDTYEGIGRYRRPGSPNSDGGLGTTSRSLVISPIIDVCGFCPNNFPNGTDSAQYTVIGFATVFIEGFQGNDLQARLISVTDCSVAAGGGGSINPLETGPYGQPLRLVRAP